ncbi:hypothetical protein P6F26_04605 [Roseibacterium sp. SDUM158017]|uniref:hypothetical protein n=1 Tax=Roseicyclus salinarum TaxID=3036773 RepID=UPI0024155C0A|nr:hypothetical protein [Roseibacterium sp. SDUM158017]MDG4647714.1 hypothetical protein [Roseibacterium sp. SDUM158017]
MFRQFLQDDSGAVTVDWVILTAAVTGLAIAVAVVVSGGVEALSTETGDALSGMSIQTAFAQAADRLSTDFSDGLGGFVGGTVASIIGFGEVLQLGPLESTQTAFAVPEGATTATITFDMLGVDDLSGEAASIMINGQVVAVYADNHGTITTTDGGVSGVSVSVSQLYSNDAVGGGSHGNDSRATYTITVSDPGETVTFGVTSGTAQPISEEFFAIDDVNFEAR